MTKEQEESNQAYKKNKCIVCLERRGKRSRFTFTCGWGCEVTRIRNPTKFPIPDISDKIKKVEEKI